MERRDSLKVLAATTGALLAGRSSWAQAADKKQSETMKSASPHAGHHSGHHSAQQTSQDTTKKTEGKGEKPSFAELNHAAAHCNHVAQMCVGHCLKLIGDGQTNMLACAQGALEVSAMSDALQRLAGINSELAVVQAKACISACEKCMKACEPHIGHHAQCKECFEACKGCLETCKAFAA
ncbi:MAG: hypothetical protein RIR26_850 [Pseudomonadota bacterium]